MSHFLFLLKRNNKQTKKSEVLLKAYTPCNFSDFCAEEETRTPTPFRALPPQGSASAISPPPRVVRRKCTIIIELTKRNFSSADYSVIALFCRMIRKVVPLPNSDFLTNISP